MYLQGVENVFDLVWTSGQAGAARYVRDVYHQNEVEQSRTTSSTPTPTMLLPRTSPHYEAEAKRLMEAQLRAARLRAGAEGRAHLQPARRARRDLRHRARRLHRPHPRPRAGGRAELLRVARAARLPDARPRRRRERGRACSSELLVEELPPQGAAAPRRGLRPGHRRRAGKARAARDRRRRSTPFATPRRLAVRISGRAARRRGPAESTSRLMPVAVAARRDGTCVRGAAQAPGQGGPRRTRRRGARRRRRAGPARTWRRRQGRVRVPRDRRRRPARSGARCRRRSTRRSRSLPIPKVMSYQLRRRQDDVRFVRPAHGLVALHGAARACRRGARARGRPHDRTATASWRRRDIALRERRRVRDAAARPRAR